MANLRHGLFIDPGITSLGWALMIGDKILGHGFKSSKSGKDKGSMSLFVDRVNDFIDSFLLDLNLTLLKYEIKKDQLDVFMEYSPFHSPSVFTTTRTYVLIGAIAREFKKIDFINVSTIRRTFFIEKPTKSELARFVLLKTGKKVNNHVADAILVGLHVFEKNLKLN